MAKKKARRKKAVKEEVKDVEEVTVGYFQTMKDEVQDVWNACVWWTYDNSKNALEWVFDKLYWD